MFLKNNFSIFFNNKPSESFNISVIILLSGLFILSFSDLLLGGFNKVYLFYALFTWLWLRLIEGIFNLIVNKKINKFVAFSFSWMIPVTIICFMGLFHLKLPIFILSIIALIDFLFFIRLNLKSILASNWKIFFYIFFSGILIIALTTINNGHFVWMGDLAYTGIIEDDTLRDAAVINSWSEYSSMSHGVHGLLFEPYHALFAIFFDPFISETINVFQAFVIFANMIMPALVVYGCSKIIINISSQYVSKNWIFFLLIFILTFSSFNSILIQRSVLMGTLLFIPFIPLVFSTIESPKDSNIEIILMCLLVPFIIYARAYHGLFALGLLFYFLLIKRIPFKLMIISSIICSVLFVLLYYGTTEHANGSLGNGYLIYFLKSNKIILNSYLIPIIVFLLFTTFKKKLFNYKIFNQITKEPFLYFIVFISILTLLLVFRTRGYSDTYYQLLPIYWFGFFFVLTSNFSNAFFKSKKQKKVFKLLNKRSLIIFILFITSVHFVQKNLDKINSDDGALKRTVKDIRILNNKWKNDGGNQLFIDGINLETCEKETFTFVCSLRTRILSITSIKELTLNLSVTKLTNKAKDISARLDGNTAVYISPSHKYWKYFEFNKNNRKFKPTMFFMGVGKLPLIFGAHPESTTLAYSIKTAHNSGGTLKELTEVGNQDKLCKIAKTVKINNIVVFQRNNEPKTIRCK